MDDKHARANLIDIFLDLARMNYTSAPDAAVLMDAAGLMLLPKDGNRGKNLRGQLRADKLKPQAGRRFPGAYQVPDEKDGEWRIGTSPGYVRTNPLL